MDLEESANWSPDRLSSIIWEQSLPLMTHSWISSTYNTSLNTTHPTEDSLWMSKFKERTSSSMENSLGYSLKKIQPKYHGKKQMSPILLNVLGHSPMPKNAHCILKGEPRRQSSAHQPRTMHLHLYLESTTRNTPKTCMQSPMHHAPQIVWPRQPMCSTRNMDLKRD